MGNKTSQPQANITKANFNPEITVLHKTVDPHYGEIKVVRDVKTGDTMILKEIVLNTKQAFEAEQNYLNTRVNVRHPNAVNVIGYNTQDKHNFCSTYYKISLFIEHLDRNLQTELEDRRNSKRAFTEGEVLLIADDMITGLAYFQEQGVSHGDIRPVNIFQRNQVYKLSDPSLNAERGSNGLNQAILRGTKTLLAPELVAQVPKQDHVIKTDKYKVDVYSLGATLLSVATLTNSEDLYNYEKGAINESLIRERLNIVRNNYTDFTHDLIEDMLIPSLEERPDFRNVSRKVAPHKDYMRRGYEGAPVSQPESRTDLDRRQPTEERVKRANLPPSDFQGDISLEELEARIRAAIARTEETFRIVKATPGLSGVFGEAKRDTTQAPAHQGVSSTTTYNYSSNYVPASNYEAPKSSYEATSNVAAPLRESGVARSQAGQDYTTSYNYTSTPVTYEYTKVEENVVRSGVTPVEDSATANKGLRASRAPLTSSNAQVASYSYGSPAAEPNLYSSSYKPEAVNPAGTTTEYNYSYSATPVTNTYTTTTYTTSVQQKPAYEYESTYVSKPVEETSKVVDYTYSYTSGTQPVNV